MASTEASTAATATTTTTTASKDTSAKTESAAAKSNKNAQVPQSAPKLSANELERVTEVFKMYETGLREATIYPKDLAVAMKALGLNPTETEIQDLINEVERNGFIYYPAFCRVIMRKLREDDEENFRRELFRVLIGPKKYPNGTPAQLININKEILTFEQFRTIMMNLPEYVDDEEVKNMFAHADKDGNGYISYREFILMCKVPEQEIIPLVPHSNGTTTTQASTSMTEAVVNAVNGALKGAASAVAATSTTVTTTTVANGLTTSSTAPVATVVTVTASK